MLPPLPLIGLVLIGGLQLRRRAHFGWSLLLLGCVGLWFCATPAAGRLLRATLLHPPPALSLSEVEALRRAGPTAPPTAIVVLGAGRRALAPEYGTSTLNPTTIERLRYALWLSRQTGLPVGYTGGIGYGAEPGPSEAEIAGRIAEREFQRPLRWVESRSRDTTENGMLMAPMLRDAGIRRLVLVTHDYHQPRALRAFTNAAKHIGWTVEMIPAPVGLHEPGPWQANDFLPGGAGFRDTWLVLHEALGLLAGS
ncbi:MAG: YdcF family protein [Rubrivivax sp.]